MLKTSRRGLGDNNHVLISFSLVLCRQVFLLFPRVSSVTRLFFLDQRLDYVERKMNKKKKEIDRYKNSKNYSWRFENNFILRIILLKSRVFKRTSIWRKFEDEDICYQAISNLEGILETQTWIHTHILFS